MKIRRQAASAWNDAAQACSRRRLITNPNLCRRYATLLLPFDWSLSYDPMPLQGYRPEEKDAMVHLLAELIGVQPEQRQLDSIWQSLERFEERGAFSMIFDTTEIVLRLKDDPKQLTLPRGVEFVKVCNDRYQYRRKRLETMLRKVFSPNRPPPPLAEVIPIRSN